MKIDLYHSLKDLAGLRKEWDALCVAANASPYACFDWFSAGVRHLGNGAALTVAVVRQGDNVLAILPLERAQERVSVLPQPVLRAAGGWIPRTPSLVAPRAPVERFVPRVFERLHATAPWRYCRLLRVPENSPLVGVPDPSSYTDGMRRVCVPVGRTVIVDIPGTWDKFRATLSPAHRKNLTRRTNGLARRGPLRLERMGLQTAPEPAALDRLLNDAITVSRKSWQARASEGRSICAPDVINFVRDISHRLAADGRLDFSVLYCGDQPVSFVWGAARWPRSTIEKLGFDAELAHHSPGLVHMGQLLADSARRGLTEIDFGHEFAEYKCRWGRPAMPLYDLIYYPANWQSRLICWWRHERPRRAVGPVAAAPWVVDLALNVMG